MRWYTWIFCIVGGLLTLGVAVLSAIQSNDALKEIGESLNWVIEFYLSLIAYFVLHLLIVTSSDFVDAFNIPPLNIGIYVDKLAAIRALLMVIADIVEWGLLDQAAQDQGKMQDPLLGGPRGPSPRRIGSIVSFIGMLLCRCVYLWIVYKSDNKSLSVFITLYIEGFWFGVFQMSFFAIGPQYNAVTSFGIHTMGNFIFFGQLLMQRQAKTKPWINPLYRVRINAWICVITSISALIVWLGFCLGASGDDGQAALAVKWIDERLATANTGASSLSADTVKRDEPEATQGTPVKLDDAMSPFLLFIVGAFAEDFAVPGILPFALLDNDKAALVNYLTPVFFMSGAFVTVLVNDVFADNKSHTYQVLQGGSSSTNDTWDQKRDNLNLFPQYNNSDNSNNTNNVTKKESFEKMDFTLFHMPF